MTEPYLCSARNFMRVPDWKWHRAIQIVDEQAERPTLVRDGDAGAPIIRQLVRFYRDWQLLDQSEPEVRRNGQTILWESWPDLYAAHTIYTEPSRKSLRWSIEAYILARETNREIAERYGAPPNVIAVYENCFFNVRRRLDQVQYIMHCVFGESLHRGLLARDVDMTWKLFGYLGGPLVVDAVTQRIGTPPRPDSAERLKDYWSKVAASSLAQRSALAAITTPITTDTGLPMLEVFAKYQELERAASNGAPESSIIENVQKMAGIFQSAFRVGSSVTALKDNPPGGVREMGAVEYRGTELMRLAANQPLPNAGELAEIGYPASN